MSKQVKLTREELYEKVWQKPTVKIAEEFGISDVMIGKLCRKMDVPKPPLGYWRRIETGAKIKQTPLPKTTDKTQEYIYIRMITEDDVVKFSSEVQKLMHQEDLPENQIKIAENLNNTHHLVLKTKQFLDNQKTEEFEPIEIPKHSGFLDLSVSKSQMIRALLILDALFKAIERRGYEIEVDESKYWGDKTKIIKEDQSVEISIREQIRKVKRELTPEEKKKPPYLLNIPEIYQSSGKLSIKVNYHYSSYETWNDRKNEPVEHRLNEITGYIVGVIERMVEEKHRKEEEERRKKEQIRQREAENQRRDKLESDAKQWKKSENIRQYLEAYEAKLIERKGEIMPDSKEDKWLKWARQYAEKLDPLNKIRTDD